MDQKTVEPAHGKSLAVTLLEALLAAVCILLIGAVLFPVFGDHKGGGPNPCLSNLKQATLALIMYAADHDERLPQAAWMDAGLPYVRGALRNPQGDDVFRCPDCPVKGGYGHAMNVATLGLSMPDEGSDDADAGKKHKPAGGTGAYDPVATILLFDSNLTGRNAVGGLETLPNPPRHERYNRVSYMDGHVGTHVIH